MIFKSIRSSDFIEGYACYTNTCITLDFLFLYRYNIYIVWVYSTYVERRILCQ